MFKILKNCKSEIPVKMNRFLRGNSSRIYSNYADTGEYHFLNKYNYVGNHGIYWTHPQSSFIIRVTDDYQQCRKGNRILADNICWCYFPPKWLAMMNKNFNEQDVVDIENGLRNWKLIQAAPKKYVEWTVHCARCFAAFPNTSYQQKMFGAKQYIATFYTDDSIENLNSSHEFSAVSDELLKNLWLIFSGTFGELTDMNQFKGQDNIPDSYIEKAILAINIQLELRQLAQTILKPKIFDLYVLGCLDYLRGVKCEKALFNKHCPLKTFISEQEGKTARLGSIGLRWILATMMTDENIALHLIPQNPAVHLAAWIVALENDLAGCYRDKQLDFSPMSFFKPDERKSDLEAAKIFANKINEAKQVSLYIWHNAPAEFSKHYEYLAKYNGFLVDYNFVNGLRKTNFRYGWIPQLD